MMYSTLFDSPATLCLLVLNLGISLLSLSNRKVFDFLALEPYRMVTRHEYHPIITSGFVHGSMSHLLLNMMTLFFFGPALEATAGSVPFLAIYGLSLIVGNLYPLYKYRRQPEYVAIGASGAISGLVFSYCLAHPTATFRVFFAIPMPAYLFAILYVAYSIYAMRKIDDNTGHEAHLAGAVGGVLATLLVSPGIVSIF